MWYLLCLEKNTLGHQLGQTTLRQFETQAILILNDIGTGTNSDEVDGQVPPCRVELLIQHHGIIGEEPVPVSKM